MAKKIIKETKYCQILNQGRIVDNEYTYVIEKIFVKQKKRDEIRFSVYKDTVKGDNRYIPRSLDVIELELIDLIRIALKEKVFSEEFITMLMQEISKLKKS